MTAVGRIRLTRAYVTGADPGFPADAALGVDGYLTTAATRMAALAGVRQSFAQAEQLLAELSGWDLDDETIRRATHAAARVRPRQRSQSAGRGALRPDAGGYRGAD